MKNTISSSIKISEDSAAMLLISFTQKVLLLSQEKRTKIRERESGLELISLETALGKHKVFHGSTVDDLGQIFDLLSAWKLKSKNAPRDLKFNHNVAI